MLVAITCPLAAATSRTSFATAGNPGQASSLAEPASQAGEDEQPVLMDFGEPCALRYDPDRHRPVPFWWRAATPAAAR